MNVAERVKQLDWSGIEQSLWELGYAETNPVLSPNECQALESMYEAPIFRKRIEMARHNFGVGEYKYFEYPLPEIVSDLRASLYAGLAPIASRWEQALGRDVNYPAELTAFLEQCHHGGQTRPTPLLLQYGQGGYNCLHQDLYGDIWFPLQATAFLRQPSVDFEGGELLLVEQRPRAQSVGHALQPAQGAMVLFATRYRPVPGARGYYRANLRHGVSRLRRGSRATLGIIFHDAQ